MYFSLLHADLLQTVNPSPMEMLIHVLLLSGQCEYFQSFVLHVFWYVRINKKGFILVVRIDKDVKNIEKTSFRGQNKMLLVRILLTSERLVLTSRGILYKVKLVQMCFYSIFHMETN